MSKIISLDDKLKLSAEQREVLARGASLGPENQNHKENPRIPYNFCDSCAEEYMEYIDQLQGKRNDGDYWYNHAWLKVWQTWIEYQGAIDQYLRSKEFRRLLDELRPEGDHSD